MQVILSNRGGGAASVLSFLLAVLIIVSVSVPSVSSRNYHNASEVMVNVNGTDRNLQYVFDNHFFNSDLRDRKGLVFSDPSTIHHGKHWASEILVSSDGKTGTLLNYLRNKTLPSGFSRNYSIPTHPATMVFFSSGKSLQELVDVGDFRCTRRFYCDGNYQVGIYADCSTSRYYCSYGCYGGGNCRSPPTISCTAGFFCDGNKVKYRRADCSIEKHPKTGRDMYVECPDGCSNGKCDFDGVCSTSRVNWCRPGIIRDIPDNATHHKWYCDGRGEGRNSSLCLKVKPKKKTVTACESNNLEYRLWGSGNKRSTGRYASLTESYTIESDISSGHVNLHVKLNGCHGNIMAHFYRIRGGRKEKIGYDGPYNFPGGLLGCRDKWFSLRNIAVQGGDTLQVEMSRTACGWFNTCGRMDMLVFKVMGCENS